MVSCDMKDGENVYPSSNVVDLKRSYSVDEEDISGQNDDAGSPPPSDDEKPELSFTVVQAMLDALNVQCAECQSLHAALRSGLRKQRDDIDALSRCQVRLHRSVAEMFRAMLGVIDNLHSKNKPQIVDGTLAKLGIARNTSAFCVGVPELTGEALRLHNAAVARICHPERSVSKTEDDLGDSGDELASKEALKTKSVKPRTLLSNPPTRTEPKQVGALLHSLVGNVSWKKAVEMVTMARQSEDYKSTPQKTASEPYTTERLKTMLRLEKPFKPNLIGRDDHLFIDIFHDIGDNFIVRVEIIYFEEDIFEFYEDAIITYVASPIDIIRRALDWADKTCTNLTQLPSTISAAANMNLGSEDWRGSFSAFQLVGSSDRVKETKAMLRYIPLTGKSTLEDVSDFRSKCAAKQSRFHDCWFNCRTTNGMWKAEVTGDDDRTNSFQRSLRQSTYHEGLVESMNWLLKKCRMKNIDRIGFKSREDLLMLVVNKDQMETRKRVRTPGRVSVEVGNKEINETKKRKQSLLD